MTERPSRNGRGSGRRLPHWARVASWVIGIPLGLLVALRLCLLIPAVRDGVARQVSRQLSSTLRGQVELRLTGQLGFSSVDGLELDVYDAADGSRLLAVDGVSAEVDTWGILRSLVGDGPLVVGIQALVLERAEVVLTRDASGLRLADAFSPVAEEPEPESASDEPGPAPVIVLQRFRIAHARVVHGLGEDEGAAVADDLEGSGLLGEGMVLELARAKVQGAVPGWGPEAALQLSGRLTRSPDGDLAAIADLEGRLGQLPLTLTASLQNEQWSARAEVRGEPAHWAELLPAVVLGEPSSVSLYGSGSFEAAHVHVTLTAAEASARVWAQLGFEPLSGSGLLELSNVDPSALVSQAPEGRIDGRGRFTFDDEGDASLELLLRESELVAHRLPPLRLSARVRDAEQLWFEVSSRGPPQLEIHGQATLAGEQIEFSVDASAPLGLDAAWVGGAELRGAQLMARGTYHTKAARLSAVAELDVNRMKLPELQLDAHGLHLFARVEGTLTEPEIQSRLRVARARHPQLQLERLRLDVAPSALGHRVALTSQVGLGSRMEGTPISVVADATLSSLTPIGLDHVRLQVQREQVQLVARARRVHAGERLEIDGFELTGIGRAHGSARLGGHAQQLHLQLNELRLAALSELMSPLLPQLEGVVTTDVSARLAGSLVSAGHVYGRARGVRVGSLGVDFVDASLVIDEGRVSGAAAVHEGSSWIRIDARSGGTDAPMSRLPSEVSILEALRGYFVVTLDVHADELGAAVAELVPGLALEGGVQAEVFVDKAAGGLRAGWFVRFAGAGYALAPDEATASDDVSHAPSWIVRGLRADVVGTYGGAPERISSSVLVVDELGQPLLGMSFAIPVSSQALISGELDGYRRLPVHGFVQVRETPLDALPVAALPSGLEARANGQVFISGALGAPELHGTLELSELSVLTTERSLPVNVKGDVRYAGSDLRVDAKIWYDQRLVAEAELAIEQRQGTRVSAATRIHRIPLGCFPYVRDYGLAGAVSAKVDYERRGGTERIDAHVFGRELVVASTEVPRLDADVRLSEGRLLARVGLGQADGSFSVEVEGRAQENTIESVSLESVSVLADDFQVRPLLMLFNDPVRDIAGVLDGRIEVRLEDRLRASGTLRVSEGTFFVPALGQGFRDVGMVVRGTPGRVLLEELRGRSGRGKFEGSGAARYTGAGRVAAKAELRIPGDRPLPITQQGVEVASASGRIEMSLTREPEKGVEIAIDVPQLDVEVDPQATRSVQGLDPSGSVTLGSVHQGQFMPLGLEEPEQAAAGEPTELTITFGDDVWLARGAGTFVSLDGDVRALLSRNLQLFGQLRAEEGQVNVLGRVFEVTQGIVSLQGETPPNPDVVAEAAWNSPAGYTIFAGFQGSVQSGKMTLRSEPPLSYSQILNVLLFDDPQGASPGGSEQPGASGVAASVAGAGLGRALSKLTDLEISAGVDTSEEGTARPEVAVRLSPRVAVGVSYNPDPAPSLGRAPDRALVTLDWRVSSRWALESSFGDRGSASADLVWRFRY